MPTLATRFRAILSILRTAIAPLVAYEHTRTAIFILLVNRIARVANRFDVLFAKWQTGTLPKPRRSRASQPARRHERPRLPEGRAWLLHVTEHVRLAAAACGSQLQHQFADPDFKEFLQAVPQAGRILRPLCHMLGIEPPLRLPPKPRPTRPRGPRPPKPDAGQPLRPIYPIGFRPPLFPTRA